MSVFNLPVMLSVIKNRVTDCIGSVLLQPIQPLRVVPLLLAQRIFSGVGPCGRRVATLGFSDCVENKLM